MRQIGINYGAMKGLTAEEYASRVRELGFDTIFTGVKKSLEEQTALADVFAKNGLIYENLHAPFGHINDIWREGEDGDRMLDELLFSVDACVASSAPILVVHLSSGVKAPSITDVGRGRFDRLISYAASKDVTLAFENQRKIGNIGWVFDEYENCDTVKFCWDCGHEACFTPGREYMPFFGKKLVCTHIHDNSKIFNGDQHLIPFDGKIDFDRFAEHIKESGYQGPLTLEIIAKNSDRYDGMDIDDYLQKATVAINKLRVMVDGE